MVRRSTVTRLLAFFLAALLLGTACGPAATPLAPPSPTPVAATITPGPTPAYPLTLRDDAGRSVTIAKAPLRIASVAPSNTEILFAVGAGDRVVAVDRFSDYPPEAKTRENLGSYVKPDLEKLVAASPDIVFATNVHAKQLLPELEARRITVFVLEPKDLDEVLARIVLVGQIVGREAQAREFVTRLKSRIDVVSAKVTSVAKKPRVFFEIDPKLFTAGPNTFIDDLIRRAGGVNVAADATTQYPQLSSETVVLTDPEVIVLADEVAGVTAESVKARAGWQTVAAVRSGRIVALNPDITSRPGPRLVDGLEALARALHPDLFR